ncbi:MAG: hypothetical protein ACE37F_19735 [Nannocystaceae bacterium]
MDGVGVLGVAGLVGCSSFVGIEEPPAADDGTRGTGEGASTGDSGGSEPTGAGSGSVTTATPTSGDATSGSPTSGDDATGETAAGDTEPSGESGSTGPAPPSCDNEVQDGGETDVDCGGRCKRCDFGESCGGATDCTTGFCSLDSTCSNQPPLVWLDALDAATMFSDDACTTAPPTDGQQVYCWQNKGSADGMFLDEGGQPNYREPENGLEFQDNPMVSDASIFGGDLGDVTIFIVQQERSSRNSYDVNLNHPATNDARYSASIPWGNATRAIAWDIGGTGEMERLETAQDIIEVGEMHQFALVNSAEESARAIRIDGEDAATGVGALAHTAGTVSVGDDARTVIYEVRVYAPSPSPQHREVIEGQLACKWGLRDLLPMGHRFHSADPEDPAGCPVGL